MFSPLLERLVQALQVLPGVGPKSAQRMAFHLLQKKRDAGLRLAETLAQAVAEVGLCAGCRTLAETTLCRLCDNTKRDDRLLCVVESPADILAIEQTGSYSGRYFVLHGRLSPIDAVGPEELGLAQLLVKVQERQPEEVILATNPTVEGETTAFYIADLIKDEVSSISRIAHGVPIGGELEYVDGGTIVHALQGRRRLN